MFPTMSRENGWVKKCRKQLPSQMNRNNFKSCKLIKLTFCIHHCVGDGSTYNLCLLFVFWFFCVLVLRTFLHSPFQRPSVTVHGYVIICAYVVLFINPLKHQYGKESTGCTSCLDQKKIANNQNRQCLSTMQASSTFTQHSQ